MGGPRMANETKGPQVTSQFSADADTVVRSLLLWVDQPWPLDETTTLRVIESAGWKPSAEEPGFFLANFFPGNDPGYFVTDLQGETAGVSLPFGRRRPRYEGPASQSPFRATFESASAKLDERFDSESTQTERGVTMTTWYPPNGTSVVLGMSMNHLSGHIYSPAMTTLALEDDEGDDDEW